MRDFLNHQLQDGLERRLSPRIHCAGQAEIITLPSGGLIVPGRILDLSLGGCGVETVHEVSPGTRAEIVLRVNSASIRVLAEVQVARERHVVGVEFLRVSAFGKHLLEDVLRELARRQAAYHLLRKSRRPHDPDDRALRSMARSIENLRAQSLVLEPAIIEPLPPPVSEKIAVILNGDEIDMFI